MSDHEQTPSIEGPRVVPAVPLIARRQLIRGAVAAVPTILTLQSGAALASTSYGVVSGTSIEENLNEGMGGSSTLDGQYHCLETFGQTKAGPWELELSDQGTNIPVGGKYTYKPMGSDTPKTAYGDEMCRTGATNVGLPGTGTLGNDTVPNGMLLSAGAYLSLAASGAIIPFRDL